ncbi:MAG: RNA pseudouridine synthase, partial [Clostridia bacterium]|nr:RNA pseudouridine synthase [Clostridia bacterium]
YCVNVVPVGTSDAKYAELSYRVLDSIDKVALLDVKLVTGRSHQIRVQLKHIGNPIYGDVKYGGDMAKGHNLALWAYNLKFTHPTTKQLMNFKVLPDTTKVPFSAFKQTISTL